MLDSFAERIYEQVEPLTYDEENQDHALEHFVGALGSMFQTVEEYASDGPNGEPGWSIILDLNRAPVEALPWLGQFVGVTIQQDVSIELQRQQIHAVSGFQRGTPRSLMAAAQQYLTGDKQVILRERNGSAYQLTIVTKSSQTPNPARVEAAIRTQKPAGIALTYNVISGQDFQTLIENHALMSNVFTYYADFEGVLEDIAAGATPSPGMGTGTMGGGNVGG